MHKENKSSKVLTYDELYLKADLLAEGVNFSEKRLLERLALEKKVRSGTGLYNYHRGNVASVKGIPLLQVFGQQNLVAPNEICFVGYDYPYTAEVRSNPKSKYSVKSENGNFILYKGNDPLKIIDFPVQPDFNFSPSPYGNLYGNVVHQMGVNALRVYPDMTCLMDKPGIKCQFCGTLPKRRIDKTTNLPISAERLIDEILTGISLAQEQMPVDHIFMSAGAFYDIETTKFYAELIRGMRSVLRNQHAEILFAVTPPPIAKVDQVDLLINAGASDLSFNLEAWDETMWDKSNKSGNLGQFKVGRGKKDHFAAYERTIDALGKGSAKSNFVGGVERIETLFQGFDHLLAIGVIPSITVFYPTPGAEWVVNGIDPRTDFFKDDPAAYLVEAYTGLAERMKQSGYKPHWAKQNRISGLEWDTYCSVLGDPTISSRVEDKVNNQNLITGELNYDRSIQPK